MDDPAIPVRERTTPRRESQRRGQPDYIRSEDTFADSFRSSSGSTPRRRKKDSGDRWDRSDEDYVEVDADPFDPFSAAKARRPAGRGWDFRADDEAPDEDWIPIVALMGCAGLIWLFGILSNALPAATPSLGM